MQPCWAEGWAETPAALSRVPQQNWLDKKILKNASFCRRAVPLQTELFSLLLVPPVGFLSFTVCGKVQRYLRSDTTFSNFARRVTDLTPLKSALQTLDSSNFPTEGVTQEFHILSHTDLSSQDSFLFCILCSHFNDQPQPRTESLNIICSCCAVKVESAGKSVTQHVFLWWFILKIMKQRKLITRLFWWDN